MHNQDLCMALIESDHPDEIVTLLANSGYWESIEHWRDLGDSENNYAILGAQQSDPVAALVEKVVNSIDARLMNECLSAKINAEGENAPSSVRRAIAQLIEHSDPDKTANGRIEHWVREQRREQAELISIAATGSKSNPCISISDLGEGQTPEAVPHTFMSLAKSNKLRIPFVQGKFNMGGTGALRFCGGLHHFQLIVTKRNPAFMPEGEESLWSFTIVRRMEPTNGERSSVYRYLAPVVGNLDEKRGLLSFVANELPIRPKGNDAYTLPQQYGSFIKLYHYEYTYRSQVLLSDGLLRQLDARLPSPALPYMMHECRDYKGKEGSFANPATGVLVRLSDDKSDNLELDFPKHDEMVVNGQKFRVSLFGFRAQKAGTYLNRSEGVLFVVNGQTHGTLSQQLFTRSKVGLDYIADSLLVSLDCSELSRTSLEELFMNTRESLAKSEFRTAVERELEDFLKHHPLLREFNNRRREEKIKEKAEDNTSLEDTLKEILSSSPSLASIFLTGQKLKTPFNLKHSAAYDEFQGKEFPSFFRFKGRVQGEELKRKAEKGRAIRIAFETDVEDNYFGRSKEPGSYLVEQKVGGTWLVVSQRSINLYRGTASLTIALEGDINVGDEVEIRISVRDDQMLEPLVSSAHIEVIPFQVHDTSDTKKKKKNNNSNDDGNDSNKDAGIELPTATWVSKDEWDGHDFNEKSVLRLVRADVNTEKAKFDFFLNSDNIHLLGEMKGSKGKEDLIREQFKVGMLLLGMSVIHDLGKEADGDVVRERAQHVTEAASLVLIPMIKHLGNLEYLLKPKIA